MMSDWLMIVLTGVTAFGWVFGVAFIVAASLARLAPRGWALRELASGRPRRYALGTGTAVFVVATTLFFAIF